MYVCKALCYVQNTLFVCNALWSVGNMLCACLWLQVAAGMKTDLQVELFAMASGLQDSEAEGTTSYYIQIQTETEILYLPVSANILSSRPGTPGGSSSISVHL